MSRYSDEIEKIEAKQKALRHSIEHSKRLAEKTDALIQNDELVPYRAGFSCQKAANAS